MKMIIERFALCCCLMCASIGFAQDCLWATRPLASGRGYTWSMASRTGDMLEMAEALFGPRDMSWTIIGAEIRTDDTCPQNWFPGYPRRKDIIFQVSPSATNGSDHACYQLAHEVVHALAPEVGKDALVIEEGAAAWFAKYYVQEKLNVAMSAALPSYRKAERAVDKLLKEDSAAIRKLRKVQPWFQEDDSRNISSGECEGEQSRDRIFALSVSAGDKMTRLDPHFAKCGLKVGLVLDGVSRQRM